MYLTGKVNVQRETSKVDGSLECLAANLFLSVALCLENLTLFCK